MTQSKYEKAKELKERIDHIAKIRKMLAAFSSTKKHFELTDYSQHIQLTDTEVAIIEDRLRDEQWRLEKEFGEL